MAFNYDKKYFHKQRLVKDCWFACYLMAKDMVNRPATKSDYEAEKKWFIENRNIVDDANVASISFQVGADDLALNKLLKEGVDTHYEIKFNSDANFIRDCLDKDYPVIIALNYETGGHYCLVTKTIMDEKDEKKKITKFKIIDPKHDGEEEEIGVPDSCNIQYYKA